MTNSLAPCPSAPAHHAGARTVPLGALLPPDPARDPSTLSAKTGRRLPDAPLAALAPTPDFVQLAMGEALAIPKRSRIEIVTAPPQDPRDPQALVFYCHSKATMTGPALLRFSPQKRHPLPTPFAIARARTTAALRAMAPIAAGTALFALATAIWFAHPTIAFFALALFVGSWISVAGMVFQHHHGQEQAQRICLYIPPYRLNTSRPIP